MTSSTDRIEVRGIVAHGFHGVLPVERMHGQTFVVDLVLFIDLAPAAATDDLVATVDYDAITHDAVARIGGEPHNLIETLAQRIADDCLARSGVASVEVTVHKPDAPVRDHVADVAVRIVRGQAVTSDSGERL